MSSNDSQGNGAPKAFDVRVLRQDGPQQSSYWQRFRVAYELDMNVISVLQRIAGQCETVDGKPVAPVAWDCGCLEEVCGACTMVINGRVRQACTALVDQLLAEHPGQIELRPMTKFPVVRDLIVDRDRLFHSLKKVRAWLPVDGYYALGRGAPLSQGDQEEAYPLSKCMSCGCCLEACPQYQKIELAARNDESEENLTERKKTAFDVAFIGPHAISQVVLHNTHPTGRMHAWKRLDALADAGGLHMCGNAQNCVRVCPKEIPLTTSIARAGRAVTMHAITKWFDK